LSGNLSRSAHAVLACSQGAHASDYTLKRSGFGRTIPEWFAQLILSVASTPRTRQTFEAGYR
jgi:hypothetical protein